MLLLALANRAMEYLQPEFAIKVYRALGDAGMVFSLEEAARSEDRFALAGHMALLFADYDAAQDLFLKSSTPNEALQMRRDLLQWDQALRLAETLAPDQVPEISLEWAKQLELRGDAARALKTYKEAEVLMPRDDTPPGEGASPRLQICQNEERSHTGVRSSFNAYWTIACSRECGDGAHHAANW